MNENSVVENSGKRILDEWGRSRENRIPAGPGLLLYNPAMTEPGFATCFEEKAELFLSLGAREPSTQLGLCGMTVVETHSDQLPLQSESHSLVVLTHLVSKGTEPVLREASRLLQPGGVLLVMGLNRYGFSYLRNRFEGVPGLCPLSVRDHLEQVDMNTRSMLAAGFLNRLGPENMNAGFSRILIPLADMLLIVARKNEPVLASPVSRARVRTVSAPSALAGP